MAQYYHILGQQGHFTLEELQVRYNATNGTIIVNPEEQYAQQQLVLQQGEVSHGGLQQQVVVESGTSLAYGGQQYIIRHESAPPPPPPPPPAEEYPTQQHQVRVAAVLQGSGQQYIVRHEPTPPPPPPSDEYPAQQHQVYYTSDRQVLQQTQQLIDASILQQPPPPPPPPSPHHTHTHMLQAGHVLAPPPPPPAAPPPPPPPPPRVTLQQHNAPPPAQLLQHMQEQHHKLLTMHTNYITPQHQQQPLQVQQQIQQQQIQQQMQHQQMQQVQMQQPQLQQQIQQQQIQQSQMQSQQQQIPQQQQTVLRAPVRAPVRTAPARAAGPRTPRPRVPRQPKQQTQQTLQQQQTPPQQQITNQHQAIRMSQLSPRLVVPTRAASPRPVRPPNVRAPSPAHRTPRPRLQQPQLQHQQMQQQQIQQQPMQQQQMQQQQMQQSLVQHTQLPQQQMHQQQIQQPQMQQAQLQQPQMQQAQLQQPQMQQAQLQQPQMQQVQMQQQQMQQPQILQQQIQQQKMQQPQMQQQQPQMQQQQLQMQQQQPQMQQQQVQQSQIQQTHLQTHQMRQASSQMRHRSPQMQQSQQPQIRQPTPQIQQPLTQIRQQSPQMQQSPSQMRQSSPQMQQTSIAVQQPPSQQQLQQMQQNIFTQQQQQIKRNMQQNMLNQQQTQPQSRIVVNQQSSPAAQPPNRLISPATANVVSQSVQLIHNASPLQTPVKKVIVQSANSGNELDDLEESITAAVVQKNPTCSSPGLPAGGVVGQQYRQMIQPIQQNQFRQQQYTNSAHFQQTGTGAGTQQMFVTDVYAGGDQAGLYEQHQQQQDVFENHQQQMVLMPDMLGEDNNRIVTLNNGQQMTLGKFKQYQMLSNQRQISSRINVGSGMGGRQTLVTRKQAPGNIPVQVVSPMVQQQQPEQQQDPSQQSDNGASTADHTQSAKMLIFLQSGEQRLITFTLPKESCTLQEVLEQINVPFTDETHIQCMQNTTSDIDYFVSVGSSVRIEEMLENHPMLSTEIPNLITSPSNISVPGLLGEAEAETEVATTPDKMQTSETGEASPGSPPLRDPLPRFVDGMLALCKACGYTGLDFNKCQRCKRVFPEEPKGVPIPINAVQTKPEKKLEQEKLPLQPGVGVETAVKLNLLKPGGLKVVKTTVSSMEKKPRVRKPRTKLPDPEPVILTLSSDDEDSNSSLSNMQADPAVTMSVSLKEPSLSDMERDFTFGDDTREDILEANDEKSQGLCTTLDCRTVRIGSYKYVPTEKVYISTKGIKIIAPSLKDENKEVALIIETREVVKVLVHFGKGLPVLFIYTINSCGAYVRKALSMTDETKPYYNPTAKEDPYKRITLLPDNISEDSKNVLKEIFGGRKVMDELSNREANEILIRTCPKDIQHAAKMITRSATTQPGQNIKPANPMDIRQILIYPPGKGGIPINTEDYMCLAQDQFLNDVIIDFYLQYLLHEVLTPQQKQKTHMFSTFFYKRLTTKPSKVNKVSNLHEWDSTLSPAQKRHARVKGWTKNVNIFSKDFLVVPINENCHWFLAIICFPSLDACRSLIDNRVVTLQDVKKKDKRHHMQMIGNTTITPVKVEPPLMCDGDNLSERDEAEAEESDLDMVAESEDEDDDEEDDKSATSAPSTIDKIPDYKKQGLTEPIKHPCILIFDSLAGASRSRVVATLRDYLTCEYQAKVDSDKKFDKNNMKGACPKIPQQNNFTDCGLYLLQYVEHFFKDPIKDYKFPIKQLSSWFDELVVTRKREEISDLLKKLMVAHNPQLPLCLPQITFPTLNGKVIESDSEQHDAETSGHASDSECPDTRPTTPSPPATHTHQENRIIIPTKLHSEYVKDIQNNLIANKNRLTTEQRPNALSGNAQIRTYANSENKQVFLKTARAKTDDCPSEVKKMRRSEF